MTATKQEYGAFPIEERLEFAARMSSASMETCQLMDDAAMLIRELKAHPVMSRNQTHTRVQELLEANNALLERARAAESDHRDLWNAVMGCCDPNNHMCGLSEGPERNILEAVIAAQIGKPGI